MIRSRIVKQKKLDELIGIVRRAVHESRPADWATYDSDDPSAFESLAVFDFARSEFDSEIRSMAKQVPRISSRKVAVAVVRRVFRSSLGDTIDDSACDRVGARLFELLSERGCIST